MRIIKAEEIGAEVFGNGATEVIGMDVKPVPEHCHALILLKDMGKREWEVSLFVEFEGDEPETHELVCTMQDPSMVAMGLRAAHMAGVIQGATDRVDVIQRMAHRNGPWSYVNGNC